MESVETRGELLRDMGAADGKRFSRGVIRLCIVRGIVYFLNGLFIGKREQHSLTAPSAAMHDRIGKTRSNDASGRGIGVPSIGLAYEARWMNFGVG